jgi:hypothetical protein
MSESRLQRSSGRRSEPDPLRDVREKAADVARRVANTASVAKEQVMRKAADMTRAVTDGVKEEAERFFDEQKGRLGEKVDRVSKVIHQAAHALHAVKADGVAEAVDAAAERFEQASNYIEERTLSDLISDTEDVARRHPGLMLGGLFLTGLVAARFVKASASREDEASGQRGAREGSSRGAGQHGRSNGRAGRRR